MSDSQNKIPSRYFELLQTQALASSIRVARNHGVFRELFAGQKSTAELARKCQLHEGHLAACIQVLVAAGVLEQYGDDIAISHLMRLMIGSESSFDRSLFDAAEAYVKEGRCAESKSEFRRRLIDRQWTHTAAAMEASSVLDIGGARVGLNVLELGCGAGVWSAPMIYRDANARITLVDQEELLPFAMQTYQSIDIADRASVVACDYRQWDVPLGEFDLVVLSETLFLETDAEAVVLLGRSYDALQKGGAVVVLEPILDDEHPSMARAALTWEVAIACGGRIRSAAEIQRLMRGAGFGEAQWGLLSAENQSLGLVIAQK